MFFGGLLNEIFADNKFVILWRLRTRKNLEYNEDQLW